MAEPYEIDEDAPMSPGEAFPDAQMRPGASLPTDPYVREIEDITEQQIALERKKGEGIARVAAEREGQVRNLAALKAQQMAEREQIAKQHAERIDMINRQIAEDDRKASLMAIDPNRYWASRTTPQKIAAGIGVLLGAWGGALTRKGGNIGLDALDDAIKTDIAIQKDAINRHIAGIERKRDLAADERLAANRAMSMLDVKHANMYDQAAKQYEATLARMGAGPEQIQSDQNIQALRAKKAELLEAHRAKMEAEQRADLLATSTAQARTRAVKAARPAVGGRRPGGVAAPKEATDAQGRAAGLAINMIEDNRTIESLPPLSEHGLQKLRDLAAIERTVGEGKLRGAAIISGILKTPEQVLSPSDLRAFQAGQRFIGMKLRGESGAVISIGEYVTEQEKYLPVLGDTKESMADKSAARKRAIDSNLLRAGPLKDMIMAETSSGAPRTAGADMVSVVNKKTGEKRTVTREEARQMGAM